MDGAVVSGSAGDDRPQVRQDLNLYEAGEDDSGNRIWNLHDPLANKFYQMYERDVELLAFIGQRSASEIAEVVEQVGIRGISDTEVSELFTFLRENNLVRGDQAQQARYMETLSHTIQRNWWELAIRNPLFFRIPFWNPDKFLDLTLPYVAWLGSRASFMALLVIGMLGFYLVSRQFDQFMSTFLHFFSWSGAFVYLLALFTVKIFHELGHAYTAKYQGCQVPTIGVAFMVGWPIFFTDTTDAWKIPDRSKRLRIGAAGVGVELGIAMLSLFLWSLMPEGAWKSAFFLLATTTWILSIFVNFNPLMRFDGYYLLSDLTDTPNLEKRSFEVAKWWLREKLFGFRLPPPEEPKKGYLLFAFGVWTYRFVLFTGIALLIYNFFFKAAGIGLFFAAIVYFIVRPVFKEVKVWWDMRQNMTMNTAAKRTIGLVGLIGVLFLVPWYNDVTLPGVLKAKSADLYLHVPGRLLVSSESENISADSPVFQFESPELTLRIEEARNRYAELSWMRSSLGFDEQLRNERLIVESDLRTQGQKLRTLEEQAEQLRIVAPFSGRIVDRSPELRAGDWLPVGTKLASVVDASDVHAIAYLPENQLARVEQGMTARFYPENPEHGIADMMVTDIEYMGTPELDTLYVASTFGGDVAVRESAEGDLLTVESQYRIRLEFDEEQPDIAQEVRGQIVIDARSVSLFSQIRRRFIAVFIRETGF